MSTEITCKNVEVDNEKIVLELHNDLGLIGNFVFPIDHKFNGEGLLWSGMDFSYLKKMVN